MKYHKVEGKLPSGVAVGYDQHSGVQKSKVPGIPWTAEFGHMPRMDFLVDRVAQYSSNAPITFRLDVPEAAAVETARVLRAMADELEGT
jgi:hypothetical protein